jgi:hypothetical protein
MSAEELDLGPIEEHFFDGVYNIKLGLSTEARLTNADLDILLKVEDCITTLIAEVKRLRSITQQTEMADDIIYKNYKRLMAQLPQCPEHGECVPYAIDWLKDLKTKNPGLVS